MLEIVKSVMAIMYLRMPIVKKRKLRGNVYSREIHSSAYCNEGRKSGYGLNRPVFYKKSHFFPCLWLSLARRRESGMRDGVSQLTQASVLWIPALRDTPECFKQVFYLYGVHGISFSLTRLQSHAPGGPLSSVTTRGQDSPWPASLTKTDGKAYLLTPTFSLINPKNEEKVKKDIFFKKNVTAQVPQAHLNGNSQETI
jgi:hypothetical protein